MFYRKCTIHSIRFFAGKRHKNDVELGDMSLLKANQATGSPPPLGSVQVGKRSVRSQLKALFSPHTSTCDKAMPSSAETVLPEYQCRPERTSELSGADRLLNAIQTCAELPGCSDVLVNGQRLWVDAGQGLCEQPFPHSVTSADVRELAIRLAAQADKRLDVASPIVDAQMPQGWRLHAVLPPIAQPGTLISLRIPRTTGVSFDDCIRQGWSPLIIRIIQRAIKAHATVLISGATGSGKTTLLSAAIQYMPSDERIVCIEEIPEIHSTHPHCVYLHERSPNIQGKGAISLEELIRAAMRMRPDRIVLGECRGSEIRQVITAFNTGHRGGAMTIHANSAADIPARLYALGATAHMSEKEITSQSLVAFDLLIHMVRGNDGVRRVEEVAVWDRYDSQDPSKQHMSGRLSVLSAVRVDEQGSDVRGPGWQQMLDIIGGE